MKAILVIDLPSHIDCDDLKRYEAELEIYDKDEGIYVLANYNLPLKLMPEKKGKDTYYTTRFGYNACIDEILGEEE